MKSLKIAGIIISLSLALCITSTSFADSGLPDITSSISNNANNFLITSINTPLPFVIADWAKLAAFYNQYSAFPAAGLYAVDTSFLTSVSSITNSAFGTLEVRYSATAAGPLANNGYALSPTRVALHGNTFYVYEIPQCFTNVIDSRMDQGTITPCTPVGVFSNSNIGTNCVYAADPYSAAVNQVQGNNPCNTPTPGNAS